MYGRDSCLTVQILKYPDKLHSCHKAGSAGVLYLFFPWCFGSAQAADEVVYGCPAPHSAALVGPFGIVADEIGVDTGLHCLDAVV